MFGSLFILNPHGTCLFEKHYKRSIGRKCCEEFWKALQRANGKLETVCSVGTNVFAYIQCTGVTFLGTLTAEASPMIAIEFLKRLVEVTLEYLGEISEDVLKENFVTVYQILEEVMDCGYPFTTENNVLRSMIIPPSALSRALAVSGIGSANTVAEELPEGVLSNIPWRSSGVTYTNNEIYLDVVEIVDAVIDRNGLLAFCSVRGDILCTSKLSGVPDLSLTFTNPRAFEDCSLHPCVRYNRFERERVFSFVPPDGKFKLASFIVAEEFSSSITIPVYIKPVITPHEGGAKINVMVGGKQGLGSRNAEDISVLIRVSTPITSTSLEPSQGSISVIENSKCIRWTVGTLPKDASPMLQGSILCASNVKPRIPSVNAEFKVVTMSACGLAVDSLNLRGEAYKPYKGVRFITRSGNYEIRCP